MELGNRKNEAKNELKRQDIVIEVDGSLDPASRYPDELLSQCITGLWDH